jgi:hypothetical protein
MIMCLRQSDETAFMELDRSAVLIQRPHLTEWFLPSVHPQAFSFVPGRHTVAL